jgi:hypothetical protein
MDVDIQYDVRGKSSCLQQFCLCFRKIYAPISPKISQFNNKRGASLRAQRELLFQSGKKHPTKLGAIARCVGIESLLPQFLQEFFTKPYYLLPLNERTKFPDL